MPIIKSAIKKLRKDIKRTEANKLFEDRMKGAIKKASKSVKETDIKEAISLVNKAAKKHIIHKNKASRLTSSLAKKLKPQSKTIKPAVKPKKSTAKETPPKK